MNVKRWLSIFISLVMLISLFSISALAEGSPEYAFIPNSGEASVSKVDLTGMTEVARYYTAPRVSATADRAWRTSRIVQDAKGNAFVLNTGADGTNLQGSAARIQADTSGLTSTHAYPADVLPFGTDQAVQVMNVGLPGEIPRAIEIEEKDGKVYLWIGFYSGGYLQKYEYNPAGPSLDPVAGANYRYTTDIKYYDMKFAPDGKLWISSRDSTPTVDGTPGIFSFDPSTGVFVREQTFVPYSLLIADDGTVYATSYNNQLHIRSTAGVWTTKTLTGSPEDRGMAFDNLGNIWIASTTGTSGGTTVKSYNIASGSQGATYTLTSGTTPVGLGMDTNGTMWVVCRSDAMAEGWLEGFKPDTLAKVGAIEVGFRPYAYGGFVIPEPELYNLCGYKLDADTGKGLAGWTINLKDSSGAVIDSTVTGPDGKYCFTGLTAGTYTVEEVPQDNWEQVYPAGGSHTVTLPEEPMIFGIERTGLRPVLRINPITGACSSLFNTNIIDPDLSAQPINDHSLNGPNGLAYDSGSKTFYFVTYPYDSQFGAATLFRSINGGTPEAIYTLSQELACADFYNGRYYYIAGGPTMGPTDDLYEVVFDGSGNVSAVNSYPNITGAADYRWTFSGDIAISAEGVIYGVGLDAKTSKQQFFSVNRDGTDFTLIDANIGMPLQLAFGSDGVLYGNNLSNNSFYTVDLTNGDTALTHQSLSAAAFNDMASGICYYNFKNQTTLGEVPAFKFYDANVNGEYDEGTDTPIQGWKIEIVNAQDEVVDTEYTDVNGLVNFKVPAGDYTIREATPNETCWLHTTDTEDEVTVIRNDTVEGPQFGNVCIGSGGGNTLGFWSNKNGQALIDTDDLAMLTALNLVNTDGSAYNPTVKTQFRTWLLDANAVNMARMLSTQLAAMALNVFNGKVNADALIYAPGLTGIANAQGFATVQSIMDAANDELGVNPLGQERAYQEALKNALDRANNNLTFVRPSPCPFTFPS